MHEFDHRHTVLSMFMCIIIKSRMILIQLSKRLPQAFFEVFAQIPLSCSRNPIHHQRKTTLVPFLDTFALTTQTASPFSHPWIVAWRPPKLIIRRTGPTIRRHSKFLGPLQGHSPSHSRCRRHWSHSEPKTRYSSTHSSLSQVHQMTQAGYDYSLIPVRVARMLDHYRASGQLRCCTSTVNQRLSNTGYLRRLTA